MNKIKTVLDRDPVNSDFIQSKQNFDEVLDGVRAAKAPFWKSSWFFGVVGTACIVMTVSVISIDSTSLTTAPQKKTEKIPKENIQKPKSTVLAVNQDDNSESELITDKVEDSPSEDSQPSTNEISAEASETPNALEQAENSATESGDQSAETTRINYYGGMFPKIGGVYTGSISVNKLCSGVQIETNPDYAVVSFQVSYYDGAKDVVKDVRGSYFPAEICQNLGEIKSPEIITLTKIKAEHRVSGKTVFLNSMNIEATPD